MSIGSSEVGSKDGIHYPVTSKCYVYVSVSQPAPALTSQPGPAETSVFKHPAVSAESAVHPTANIRESKPGASTAVGVGEFDTYNKPFVASR
jgi:hypothetical protein